MKYCYFAKVQYYQLNMMKIKRFCDDILPSRSYEYVYVNDFILFYLFRENKLTTLQNTLPSPLRHCVALFNKRNILYIIGCYNEKKRRITKKYENKFEYFKDVGKQQTISGKIKVIENGFFNSFQPTYVIILISLEIFFVMLNIQLFLILYHKCD
ncbi:hypothetical protein RFI_03226 [Reticulomyxa filosa]|uniref:Uncharacterized protein n=1 Tax=Reticulomyxa filosa TaxID=46433 RepID=X6P6T9_RETFI|nr:hypothetical protein RFI_03226 [Reticulomyxa filosa]|eukprot:ETO33871.1 hypothetical protein RFI_03226 [Reticulomyxa filosa]